LRYIAPEVYLGQNYNLLADVYSFSMILFQLLFWRLPFNHLSCEQAAKTAAYRNERPRLPPKGTSLDVSDALRSLTESAWEKEYWLRPYFPDILEVLEAELDILEESGEAHENGP
jgi:serine/threonine protein kinase